MVMTSLKSKLSPLWNSFDQFEFGIILRMAREALGLKQNRVCAHLGITPARLKNLETGYFRIMPRDEELEALADLYDIDYQLLDEKAREYVSRSKLRNKITRSVLL